MDFKGPQAKRDRQRLLLYRIFENRLHIQPSDIEALIRPHLNELLRLNHISGSEHEAKLCDFIEAWPYSPELMQLLDDQVLIATDTQETRDLLRILVDVFKTAGDRSPVITAADFSLINDKSGVASLLDSVANQIKTRFDRFAILDQWNFGQPEKCVFLTTSHNTDGGQILPAMQEITKRELFIPEELESVITDAATTNRSVANLLEQLKEPMGGGQPCIPWLGETEAKELITRACAQGKVAIMI